MPIAPASSGCTAGRRVAWIAALFVGTTTVHVLIGHGTHALHVVHVVFRALYLVPIVAAAIWLGPRPAVGFAVATAGVYAVYARTAWAGNVMENTNQLAFAATYVFVGLVTAGLVQAAERERRAKLEVERSAQRTAIVQAIATLSGALRQRDDGTAAHSERVARIAVRIGEALRVEPARLELLRLASLVHDVGKIGVRDDVLFKPDQLTAEERTRIERHPQIAAEILRPIRGAEELAEVVLSHHECPDGSGYPRHLAGASVPLEARVLRVADVYAALVEPRPYKHPLAPVDALARMKQLVGKLDGAALEALERVVAEGTLEGETEDGSSISHAGIFEEAPR